MGERPWEALTEFTFYVSNDPESIYCLCSRAFIRNDLGLEFGKDDGIPEEVSKSPILDEIDVKIPSAPLNRKQEFEALSCYCSASHYSTDDYESGAHVQHNSDSGADLSENLADRMLATASKDSGRAGLDLAWERFWAEHGEAIIWKSWIERYGAYINPVSNGGNSDVVKPETEPEAKPIPDVKVTCSEDGEDDKLLKSDSFGSANGYERGRRVRSRCSNSSVANTTVTTDSMTNVTKITLSSLDLSCDSNSLLSSSTEPSSGPSSESSHEENIAENDAWWRRVWKEHYEDLFSQSFRKFQCDYQLQPVDVATSPPSTDDETALENAKAQLIQKFCLDQPEVQEFPTSDGALLRLFGESPEVDSDADVTRAKLLGKFGAHERRENSFRSWSYVNSVGYILQKLNKTSLSTSSQVVDAEGENGSGYEEEAKDKKADDATSHMACPVESSVNIKYYNSGDDNDSEDEEEYLRRRPKKKSAHEKDDVEKPSPKLDKVKAAMGLLTLPFQPTNVEPPIVSGHVTYRKRNIRAQNRRLKLTETRQRVHLFFDDDGNVERRESTPLPSPPTPALESEALGYEAHSSSLDDDTDAVDGSVEGTGIGKKQRKRKRKARKTSSNSNLPIEILENKSLLKYWHRRYQLFLKYDAGIRLDGESWFSVTPEKIAAHHAERCRCDLIIDAFCGAGGNAIQFAFTCEKVIAIDIDPEKIALAKHNAAIYGVADRIDFIVGDFTKLAPTLHADVVFLSPPWGGPKYTRQGVFPLSDLLSPVGGVELYRIASSISHNVAIFLPRNINSYEVSLLGGAGGSVELEQSFLNSKLIGVTAYFNGLILDPDNPEIDFDSF